MSIIATSSDELKFHQWSDGELKQYYRPPNHTEGPIKTISWGRDGNLIVVVPSTGPAEVVSIKENVKVLQTIQDIYRPTCATFQNNAKRNIAVGTLSGQVLVYDIKVRNVKKRFPRASSTIFNLQYNSKDSHVAAACSNGDIQIYNHLTTNLSSLYKVPRSESVSAINFHRSKRNFLAAGSDEGIVATWDINTNAVLCDMNAHHAPVTDLTFSPIRSDLLITAGLDRRFAFYDLLAKKCIIEVEVSSSTTALDFSPCGTYLGLGSQNGNVILYDTRNFSKPISAFVGHDGKSIRQLFFQKVPFSSNVSDNSSFDVAAEDPVATQDLDNKNENGDSLALVMCDDTNTQIREDLSQKQVNIGDSFLAALGMDNSNSETSFKQESSMELSITEEVRKWIDGSKRVSLHQNQLSENINATKTPASNTRQISSTPKYLTETRPVSSISPIVGTCACQTSCGISVNDLKQTIQDVKDEFQTQFDVFKEEVRMEFAEALSHQRRNFLDLQISMVKQFVSMESKIDNINNATVREFICDDFLIKKNNELIKEVEMLRERMLEKDSIRRKF